MKSKSLLLALGLTATTAWLLLRKRKTMSQLPVSVGDAAAQQRFIAAHKSFLMPEFPELKSTLETLIDESHKKVSEQRRKASDDSQNGIKTSLDRLSFHWRAQLTTILRSCSFSQETAWD